MLAHKFDYKDTERKPAIPKRSELRPTMGLASQKNFVVSNALENILSKPPKEKTAKFDQTNFGTLNGASPKENNANVLNNSTLNIADRHAEFGKVPEYLKTIKQQVQEEYDYINSMKTQKSEKTIKSSKKVDLLDEAEKIELLNSMKDKWEKINAAYQQMTIHVMPETKSSLARKEYYETEMAQLEKDIEKLSKPYVFVKQ